MMHSTEVTYPKSHCLGSGKAGTQSLAAQLRAHAFNDYIKIWWEKITKTPFTQNGMHVPGICTKMTRYQSKAKSLPAPLPIGGEGPSESLQS